MFDVWFCMMCMVEPPDSSKPLLVASLITCRIPKALCFTTWST